MGVILYILVSGRPPFDGPDNYGILESVKKQVYSLDGKRIFNEVQEMAKISSNLKNLIKLMLVPANKRITLDQIYEHPWMR